MPITEGSNYHIALVFYPWVNPYPLENKANADKNILDNDPVIYASGGKTISGITSVQFNRRKSVGGSMAIEFTGYIKEEDKLTIGTWCYLATSHVSPITTMDDIKKRGLVRFIGQVYEINSQYQVDSESGRLARKVTYTVREWCHALHCPLRYHPHSKEANLNALAQSQTLSDTQKTDKARSELISKIGSSVTNVFQQPFLALAWVGGLSQKSDDSLLKAVDVKISDLALFSTVIARLPVLPKKMLKDLGFSDSVKPDTAWSDGFLTLLSGVQKWGDGGESFFGTKVKPDELARRPVSPTPLDFVMSGNSLYSMIGEMVAGGGGTEVFADLWYDKKDTKWLPRPVFVVRDIPFTLKSSEKVLSGGKNQEFPWTYFDDLPTVDIPSSRITRISLTQSLSNTANLIQMSVANGDWSKVAEAQALRYFGTTVLAESQKRFGAQVRPALSIRDIFLAKETTNTKGSSVITPQEAKSSDIRSVSYQAKASSESGKDGYLWFSELNRKQIQWFGSDYLFPSCSLMVKDADFPLATGVNISLKLPSGVQYVGHCEGFSQAFMVDASGRITNTTNIQMSRLCMKSGKILAPMSYRSVVNFLNQGSALSPDDIYQSADETSQYTSTNDVDTESARQIIIARNDAIENTMKKAKEESDKANADALKNTNAKKTPQTKDAIEQKKAKRK